MSHVTDVTDQNFEAIVLKSDVPVVVDFWAPWCGPCKTVGRIMEELAETFRGKAHITKVNIDQATTVARDCGVSGLPTVLIFRDGRRLESIHGNKPISVYVKALESLLQDRGNNTSIPEGETIFTAIRSREQALIEAFIEQQPEQLNADQNGRSPLMEALLTGDRQVIQMLNASKPAQNIFELAGCGPLSILEEMIAAAPGKVCEKSAEGYLPLHFAALGNRGEAVRILLKAGATIDELTAGTVEPKTFFYQLMASNSLESLSVLLENGLDPNRQLNSSSEFLLHIAAGIENEKAYDLLCRFGADESLENHHGDTAKQAAASTKLAMQNLTHPLVMILKGEDGDANALDTYLTEYPATVDAPIHLPVGRLTPLQLALLAGQSEFIAAILQHDPYLGAIELAGLNRSEELRTLFANDPSLAIARFDTLSPAIMAVRCGSLDALQEVINAGQDPADPALLQWVKQSPIPQVGEFFANQINR